MFIASSSATMSLARPRATEAASSPFLSLSISSRTASASPRASASAPRSSSSRARITFCSCESRFIVSSDRMTDSEALRSVWTRSWINSPTSSSPPALLPPPLRVRKGHVVVLVLHRLLRHVEDLHEVGGVHSRLRDEVEQLPGGDDLLSGRVQDHELLRLRLRPLREVQRALVVEPLVRPLRLEQHLEDFAHVHVPLLRLRDNRRRARNRVVYLVVAAHRLVRLFFSLPHHAECLH